MTSIISFPITRWDHPATAEEQTNIIDALEAGNVVLLPQLDFTVDESERSAFASQVIGASKNISLQPSTGELKGFKTHAAEQQHLQRMMMRFATSTRSLLDSLLAPYGSGLLQARTSFRPSEILGRRTSWRKDDTRLHVDSFPSSPTRGRRILRVFTNINPVGQPRTWRVGEAFETVAERYLPELPRPLWGSSQVLNALGITKTPRSAYDHYMLHLHDQMKHDEDYQKHAVQSRQEFAPGTTWMVFTDQVSHAAMSGQYVLEQTYLLEIEAMLKPEQAPLRVLERLMGQALI